MIKQFAVVTGLAVIAACGPLERNSIASQVSDLAISVATGKASQATPQRGVSQEELLANPGKYIRVSIRNQERWGTAVESGRNADRVTWVDSDNISVTFENGIVVATRGLPRDLIAADVSESWSAIASGGGEAHRTHETLSNMDSISTEVLQCRIASEGFETVKRLGTEQKTTKFTEDCASPNLEFANVYWVNRQGRIVRSLQAISPGAGYLQIDIF
ncbi:YjbF family lipoprotein [Yoonia sediminilitoris]|uniref:Group 4 capsule polysaccharide lipoprotein GfcB/YjbF n=1 Tax=Yoonia sediminilitoris TaxID=1286148 RepID=A0A2T6K9V3_9RHOB|nr:YjbF family lipoprotein [Yoonia sediminilitoris]PUB11598.1 group 4 capsule polysaccharide lipoprotein GfcB/YjbF [Yoonia sediminilitoris]RCW91798.1 group 4 capsule polysaccharide lipoprotein GfcB/YjbF [Yoonia sediminilitoris]